jgi:hypothetical protein
MDVKKIKQFLGERGIDKHLRIERNGGGQYLYNLLCEFNDIVKNETKNKIIKELNNVNITD